MAWLDQRVVDAAGWTLVHSVWELALVAGVAWLVLRALPVHKARTRYAAALLALAAMVGCVAGTAADLWGRHDAAAVMRGAAAGADGVATNVPALRETAAVVGGLPQPSPQRPMDEGGIMRWVVAAYAAGAALCGLRLLAGCAALWRLRRGSVAADAGLALRMERLAKQMWVRTPRVRASARVDSPMVIGVLRPLVLVPVMALTGLTAAQIEALLAHELAHLRRADPLVNFLQSTIEAVLFYHPAVWWISRRIREERECCCDEAAVLVVGDRADYAKALARMETLRGSMGLAMGAGGGNLVERVRRVLRAGERERFAAPLAGVAAACMIALAVYLLGCAHAQKGAPSQQAASAQTLPQPEQVMPYADLLTGPPPDEEELAAQNKRIAIALDAPIDFAADNEGFEFLLDRLQKTTGIEILANWRELKLAGIDEHSMVSLQVTHAPLRKVLLEICNQVGGEHAALGFIVDVGTITVSTKEDLQSAKYQNIRVYDVRDLLTWLPEKPPDLPVAGAEWKGPTPEEVAAYKKMALAEIEDTLQKIVAPDTWKANGGKIGIIRELNGQLIVNQTEENQAAVGQLLEQLHETHALQIAVEAVACAVTPQRFAQLERAHPGLKDGKAVAIGGEAEAGAFLKDVKADAATWVSTMPRVTVFNGHGTGVWGEAGSPAKAQGTDAFALAVTATITVDRKAALLEMKCGLPEVLGKARGALVEKDVRVIAADQQAVAVHVGSVNDAQGGVREVVWLVRPSVIVQRYVEKPGLTTRPSDL